MCQLHGQLLELVEHTAEVPQRAAQTKSESSVAASSATVASGSASRRPRKLSPSSHARAAADWTSAYARRGERGVHEREEHRLRVQSPPPTSRLSHPVGERGGPSSTQVAAACLTHRIAERRGRSGRR